MNNEIVHELVQRMGIEYRSGIPLDELHDLARKQLSKAIRERARERQHSSKYATIEERFADTKPHQFAFKYIDNKLQVVRVDSLETVRFVEWHMDNWPLVENIKQCTEKK